MELLSKYTRQLENQRRARPIIRSLIAQGQALYSGETPEAIAHRRWRGDPKTIEVIERGAATITGTTTANVPTSTSIAALVPLLGPLSAIGNVLARCLQLSFGESSTLSVPTIAQSGTLISFIGQGAPSPVRQLTFGTSTTMTPKKSSLIYTMSRELFEHSNAETVIGNVLAADISLGLETILFDATASDTIRPAGLRNGIGTLTADAGTGLDGMMNDLSSLASAVSAVGGLNLCYIASPKQAIKILLRKTAANFPFSVYASSALADKMVCCLAVDALAVAGDTAPKFTMSKQTVLHMEDTSPAQIVSAGPTLATPVQSTWQTDAVAVKLMVDLSWVLRSATGFAYITAVNW